MKEIATRHQIEDLKRSWTDDPCWDLEETEGFEAHREELLEHSLKMSAHWHAERCAKLSAKAVEIGCPGNVALAQAVLQLEQRLAELEAKLEELRK